MWILFWEFHRMMKIIIGGEFLDPSFPSSFPSSFHGEIPSISCFGGGFLSTKNMDFANGDFTLVRW